jgi:hypothetical protein
LLKHEHTPAHGSDHWPIATNERGEGGSIAAHDESVQQSLIAVLLMALRSDDLTEIANACGQCGSAHNCDSEGEKDCFLTYSCRPPGFPPSFFIRSAISIGVMDHIGLAL